MLGNVRKYGTKALIGLGSLGRGSRSRAAQAARSTYRRSAPTGPRAPVSSRPAGFDIIRSQINADTNARTAAQRKVARSRAEAARDASFYSTGRKRAIAGSAIVGGGAITANPKSNQSRTAPFGSGARRAVGTGRYA